MLARTGSGCFSNGETGPHNLVAFPLVGRAFGGQGLSGRLTIRRNPDDVGIRAVAVYVYDSAGLHDYFCIELKPAESQTVDLEQFLHVVHTIQDFWLTIVKLPPQ